MNDNAIQNKFSRLVLIFLAGAMMLCTAQPLTAQESESPGKTSEESPWLFTPTVSSDPKVGTTLGLMGGYLHKFDNQSTPSMFLLTGKYSNTDSWTAGVYGQVFFDEDRQRIIAGHFEGEVRNDYDDFLNSGLPAQTTDNLNLSFFRYLHHISSNWYLGAQAISSNYAIGADAHIEEFLEEVSLTGFDSNGLGLVVEYDSRNNMRNPTEGTRFNSHNIAYRKSFGGDESFDVYGALLNDYRQLSYKNIVLASQIKGRWTHNAPPGGYSSLNLRGYVRGQSLAPHYTHVQADARMPLNNRWGITLFGGLGCLYESVDDCGDRDNLYPAIGAGAMFLLKKEAGLVLRAEYAIGKGGNSGFYLRLGHPF